MVDVWELLAAICGVGSREAGYHIVSLYICILTRRPFRDGDVARSAAFADFGEARYAVLPRSRNDGSQFGARIVYDEMGFT